MTKEELEKEAIKCMHEIKFWLRIPIKKETAKDGISEILKLTEPREKSIETLEKENRVLKYFIKDLIYENHNLCSQFNNTTCLFNSDYKNRAEELIGGKLLLERNCTSKGVKNYE